MPFVTEMAVFYLSLIPLMLLLLCVFRTGREIFPLFVVLVAETLIAFPFFLALPVEQTFPQPSPRGLFASWFHFADFVNLEGNDLPSLHVSYAFTAALAIGRQCGPIFRAAFLLWATGIATSSLLLYQHNLADVLTGIALAGLMMGWLYDRLARPELLRALRVEMVCLAEIYRCSRRHLRYLVVGIIVYCHSLFRWRDRRPIRVGFCFLQHIDDLLDGDCPSLVEPGEVVDRLLEQIEIGSFEDTSLGCLARCLWEDTARSRIGEDDPHAELVTLIRLMQRDRYRVKDGLLLSRDELLAHHRQTFHYAVNLMLMLGGAELRARDAPELIEAFGWCSTMRDLREDLEKGLVNVPASVIEACRMEGLTSFEYDALSGSPAFRRWVEDEYLRATRHLDRSEDELSRLRGRNGAAILRLFHRSIRRFARRTAKIHGWRHHRGV